MRTSYRSIGNDYFVVVISIPVRLPLRLTSSRRAISLLLRSSSLCVSFGLLPRRKRHRGSCKAKQVHRALDGTRGRSSCRTKSNRSRLRFYGRRLRHLPLGYNAVEPVADRTRILVRHSCRGVAELSLLLLYGLCLRSCALNSVRSVNLNRTTWVSRHVDALAHVACRRLCVLLHSLLLLVLV